jgi:hypothetical protein
MSIFLIPMSWTACAQSRAACVAANGVDFLDPLNPFDPPDAQTRVAPSSSEIVMIVLLNVDLMCATPCDTWRFDFFLVVLCLRLPIVLYNPQ